MSLYGDLPPTEGQNDAPVISSGWAKPKLNNITRKPTKDEKKKSIAVIVNQLPSSTPAQPPQLKSQSETSQLGSSQYIPSSISKFAPFKPRQANKPAPTSSQLLPSTPILGSTNMNISLPTETIVRKKINDPKAPKVDQENAIVLSNREPESGVDAPERSSTYDCSDPYDPSKPNDYLKYCEERTEKKRHKHLEEENKRAIDEAERVREAVEKERAKAMEEGDLARVQATLVGVGRGRGRGLTNLPAWMTTSAESSTVSTPQSVGQFDDEASGRKRKPSFDSSSHSHNPPPPQSVTPTSVIVLKNMLPPLERERSSYHVQEEVREECQRYGSVQEIEIEEIEVRDREGGSERKSCLVVYFNRVESAVKALQEMDGRYYGGQRIRAEFKK
jgi:splicing factor 45